MLILPGFAFLAGFVTVLSPCVLPVLPILLSGGLSGGKRRPAGIVTGFVASFTLLTLTLSFIVQKMAVSADALRGIAVLFLGVFGLVLALPELKRQFERHSTKALPRPSISSPSDRSGFISGLPVGMSLGIIWTPCVGPILATVITLAAANTSGTESLIIVLAYSAGTGIPMLAIMQGGRALSTRLSWVKTNSMRVQQVFGALIVVMALILAIKADKKFETWLLKKFPEYGRTLISIEDRPQVQRQLEKLRRAA